MTPRVSEKKKLDAQRRFRKFGVQTRKCTKPYVYVVDCSPEADNLCLPEPFSIRSDYVLCSEKAQAQPTTDG